MNCETAPPVVKRDPHTLFTILIYHSLLMTGLTAERMFRTQNWRDHTQDRNLTSLKAHGKSSGFTCRIQALHGDVGSRKALHREVSRGGSRKTTRVFISGGLGKSKRICYLIIINVCNGE